MTTTYIHVKDGRVDVRRIGIVNRVGRAGQNDTLRFEVKILNLLGAREHLRVDIELTEAAGDQMAVLRSGGGLSQKLLRA